MAILQLLPGRLRVAVNGARNNAAGLVRALRDPRFKGGRKLGHHQPLEVRFVPPRQTAAPKVEENSGGVVVFADSGVTVKLEPGETILEGGLRHGVDLLFSCTLGGCGACMLHIAEGEVHYDDLDAICLTPEEIEDGCCLACVGKPRGDVVLEA